MKSRQKGVILIVTFFIMTIIIAVVFSISTILFNELHIISGIGNSVTAFYAADSGIEKTLYFNKKQLVAGAARGMCNMCRACNSRGLDPTGACNNCTLIPLVSDGCNMVSCSNCQLRYDSAFGGSTFTVSATVNPADGFYMISKGFYKDAARQIEINSK